MTTHDIDFRVYYEDTDAGGVVYHARYLGFAERARTEALRGFGISAQRMLEEHGLVFVVKKVAMEYFMPLKLDDIVTITTRLTEMRGASCRLEQLFKTHTTLSASLDVQLACLRIADGRPARFPPEWRELLMQLVS